jgi:hypothetical protein
MILAKGEGRMKKAMLLGCAVVLLLAGHSFAADTFESVLKELTATMKELVDVLKSVKDADTAKTAAPKLEKVNVKGEDLTKRLMKLGKPTSKEEEALVLKFGKDMKMFGQDIDNEAKRIKEIKGTGQVMKLLEKVTNKK